MGHALADFPQCSERFLLKSRLDSGQGALVDNADSAWQAEVCGVQDSIECAKEHYRTLYVALGISYRRQKGERESCKVRLTRRTIEQHALHQIRFGPCV